MTAKLVRLAEARGVPVEAIGKHELNLLTDNKAHQASSPFLLSTGKAAILVKDRRLQRGLHECRATCWSAPRSPLSSWTAWAPLPTQPAAARRCGWRWMRSPTS